MPNVNQDQLRPAKDKTSIQVFVSHSTKDREFLERELIPFLNSLGIQIWYSQDAIHTAADWERSIREGLSSCDWFLVVMSENSATSEWVRTELHWAFEERPGRIIPVLISPCDPDALHLGLRRIQHIDFQENRNEALNRLANIWQKPEPQAHTWGHRVYSGSKGVPKARRRRHLLFAIGGMCVVALLIYAVVRTTLMLRDSTNGRGMSTASTNGMTPHQGESDTSTASDPSTATLASEPLHASTGSEEVFAHPELQQFLFRVIIHSHSHFAWRNTYSEISRVIDTRQSGRWLIGTGMAIDGSAYEVTVQQGKWYARRLSADEAAVLGAVGESIQRGIQGNIDFETRRLVTLQEPELQLVSNAKGDRKLTGTIDFADASKQPVDHISLIYYCPIPEKQNATATYYQHFEGDRLPEGAVEISIALSDVGSPEYGGRFILDAYVPRPIASFYHVSNELVVTGDVFDQTQ